MSVFKKRKQNVIPETIFSSNSSINPHFSLGQGSIVKTGNLPFSKMITGFPDNQCDEVVEELGLKIAISVKNKLHEPIVVCCGFFNLNQK